MWRVFFQQNWGTRLPRRFHNFYTTRKPTQQEAIDILNFNGIEATASWFAPHNSGLVGIEKIKFEF